LDCLSVSRLVVFSGRSCRTAPQRVTPLVVALLSTRRGSTHSKFSAWPYTQFDLTLGREGAASAVGDQLGHLEIVDVVRDDLFTVLFEKNGIRYSVVGLPEDEAWLTDILTTWRFTE
jgi:hypothetical protein